MRIRHHIIMNLETKEKINAGCRIEKAETIKTELEKNNPNAKYIIFPSWGNI